MAYHFQRSGGWVKDKYDCDECLQRGHYRGRNCRKFPELIPLHTLDYRPHKRAQWTPEYVTRKGRPYYPNDSLRIRECPVSFIDPESVETVLAFANARLAHESSGAGMYGPDLSAWPAWAVDALTTLERERIATENARIESEYREKD